MSEINWESVWDDILHQNGNPRWKIDDQPIKEQTLRYIIQYHQQISATFSSAAVAATATAMDGDNSNNNNNDHDEQQHQQPAKNAAADVTTTTIRTTHDDDDDDDDDEVCTPTTRKLNIFCPLAGDDPLVALAWQRGHTVTTIDLVGTAVAVQRAQISKMATLPPPPPSPPDKEEDNTTTTATTTTDDSSIWTEMILSPTLTKWSHSSGRATCYVGDALQSIHDGKSSSVLHGTFDVVYDKDAFGALPPSLRTVYCDRLSEYLKPGTGMVYTEVKLRSSDHPDPRSVGPPYHVEPDDLMMSYGAHRFEYVANLGQVYNISFPPGMIQTGHILRRKL